MKIYAEHLEQTALDQFNDAMEQDFVVGGALMPDAHTGYALPIGAVVSTKDVVVPAWVGYDIGCGVLGTRLDNITKQDIEKNKDEIFGEIYKQIPVGFNVNTKSKEYDLFGLTKIGKGIAIKKKYDKAIGTLGGGNHFIEIGYDEEETAVVIIHSGSRGVGHGIATHYMKLAKELNSTIDPSILAQLAFDFEARNYELREHMTVEKYNILQQRYIEKNKPKTNKMLDGHYALNTYSQHGGDYIRDMNWCAIYAIANRESMFQTVRNIIEDSVGKVSAISMSINKNHNHAEYIGEGIWVHRKGATQADNGMLGIIPGNMRDGSFIVIGKGNKESLCSSSHGAGRVLGRKEAKRKLNVKEFKESMVGIKGKIDEDTLDESPLAYKDIFEVMDLQKDLVDIISHIKPIINIKG